MTLTFGPYRVTLSHGIRVSFLPSITPQYKAHVVECIQQANSQEYRLQVAEYDFLNAVIDRILDDPYWLEVAVQAER